MTSGQTPAVFDRAVLDANTMANHELQCELMDLYFGQAPSLLDAMREGVAHDARRTWREAAHALKGTARTLGFLKLGEASAAAEAAAPSPAALARVEAALREAKGAAGALTTMAAA